MQVEIVEPQLQFADRLADLVGRLLAVGEKTDRVELARTIADIHNRAVGDGIEAGLARQAVVPGTRIENVTSFQIGLLLEQLFSSLEFRSIQSVSERASAAILANRCTEELSRRFVQLGAWRE